MFKKFLILMLFSVMIISPVFATVTGTYTPVQLEADGVLVDFDFDFKVFSTADIDVSLVDQTTLVATAQVLGVDYTAVLSTSTEGGTITFTGAPADTNDVYMARDVAVTQPADIPSGGLFREVQIENALDRSIMISQQQQEAIDRAVLQNPFTTTIDVVMPLPEADKLIGWNADADGLENKVVIDADVQAAAEASAAAALVSETNSGVSETNAAASAALIPLIADETALDILRINAGKTANEYVTLKTILNITGLTNKATPVDADELIISDSADSNNLKAVTLAALDMKYKIGSFTRDVSLSSGTQAITGVGFRPKFVIFLATINLTKNFSIGFDDATTKLHIYGEDNLASFTITATASIRLIANTTNNYFGDIQSMDADGFTIDWTKVVSPTGSASIAYLAIK